MKKVFLISMVSIGLGSVFSACAAETPVTVDGGKISFTGSVVAAPCAVDNTSDGQTVNLGQVPTNRLTAKGNSSSAVPFTIKLTGCDLSYNLTDPTETASYTSAAITFLGTTSGDDTTLAIQSASGGVGDTIARNVGIQILSNNTAVKLDGSTATAAQKIVAGSNEIPFSAVYVATADGVVAGDANSTVSFQVTYQ